MKSRARIIAALVACVLSTAGCKQDAELPQPVRPVLSTVVEPARSAESVLVGAIEPQFKTDLAFRVLGRLIDRPVKLGDSVAEGQTVATIDSVPLELAVRAARAELSKTEAQLARASATEQRKRMLIATDATTRQTLDDAEQVRTGAEASVAHAQANLTKALEQLGYAELKADFAGVVTAVSADVGQVVAPGQTVVTIARPDVREAVVDIGPDFPVPLRIGLPFQRQLAASSHGSSRGPNSRDCAPGRSPHSYVPRPHCLA